MNRTNQIETYAELLGVPGTPPENTRRLWQHGSLPIDQAIELANRKGAKIPVSASIVLKDKAAWLRTVDAIAALLHPQREYRADLLPGILWLVDRIRGPQRRALAEYAIENDLGEPLALLLCKIGEACPTHTNVRLLVRDLRLYGADRQRKRVRTGFFQADLDRITIRSRDGRKIDEITVEE